MVHLECHFPRWCSTLMLNFEKVKVSLALSKEKAQKSMHKKEGSLSASYEKINVLVFISLDYYDHSWIFKVKNDHAKKHILKVRRFEIIKWFQVI